MLQQKKKGASQPTGATEQGTSINEGRGKDHLAGQGNILKESSAGSQALHGKVQVQASPRRNKALEEQQTSPGRILLGIDKGLKAKNVSLRNPRSPRKSTKADFDPFTTQRHDPAAKNAVTKMLRLIVWRDRKASASELRLFGKKTRIAKLRSSERIKTAVPDLAFQIRISKHVGRRHQDQRQTVEVFMEGKHRKALVSLEHRS